MSLEHLLLSRYPSQRGEGWRGEQLIRRGAGLVIRKHDHCTPARKMRPDGRALTARSHPEGRFNPMKRRAFNCTSHTGYESNCSSHTGYESNCEQTWGGQKPISRNAFRVWDSISSRTATSTRGGRTGYESKCEQTGGRDGASRPVCTMARLYI